MTYIVLVETLNPVLSIYRGDVKVLGVASSNSDVDVVAELRSRLEAAGLVATASSLTQNNESVSAAVTAESTKYEATIAELKASNESLKAKLKAVYKSSQETKQRHSKDVAKLHKTVAELQQRVREQQATEVERESGVGGDGGGAVGATSVESHSGVVLPPVGVSSPQSRPSLTNPLQATHAGDRDRNSTAAVQLSTSQAPSSPVVMPPLQLPKTSPITTARPLPPTTAVVLPSLATDSSVYQHNINEQSSSLRSQVGFVSYVQLGKN